MSRTHIELDELLAVRREAAGIDFSSRRRVMTELSGPQLSGFRGRGMEFEEHRSYQAGDEVRSIDWRVTARTGQTHVRLYREERERPVLLAVDLRAAMHFGTRGCFKSVRAAESAAACAWGAAANGDRVGGLAFSEAQHLESRPAAGRRGVLQLCHQLDSLAKLRNPADHDDPSKAADSLFDALLRLNHTAAPGALVAVFSDFRGLQERHEQRLLSLARHCELILGFIHDPLEQALPPPGRYAVQASAQEAPRTVGTASRDARQRWAAAFEARRTQIAQLGRRCRAHWWQISTADSLSDCLNRGFGRRRNCA